MGLRRSTRIRQQHTAKKKKTKEKKNQEQTDDDKKAPAKRKILNFSQVRPPKKTMKDQVAVTTRKTRGQSKNEEKKKAVETSKTSVAKTPVTKVSKPDKSDKPPTPKPKAKKPRSRTKKRAAEPPNNEPTKEQPEKKKRSSVRITNRAPKPPSVTTNTATLRRTKRIDNQLQREKEYTLNVQCRDRRSYCVLRSVVRFVEMSSVLKQKHEEDEQRQILQMEKTSHEATQMEQEFAQPTPLNNVVESDLVDLRDKYYTVPCPSRHIIPNFDLSKGVNDIIIHPDMDSNTISFPKKIWYVVNAPECKSIWWFSDGRSFLINKRWIKEKGELLDGQKYTTGISMNISDYSSLVRQLNLYGFRKVKRAGAEMTEFQTHYMAAMADHPFSAMVGKAALQDVDEFRHTFFTTSNIQLRECSLGEEKVQFIKRQKPFKPTNNRKMPEKFDPKIRKSSAQRPHRHNAHSPSSNYSDESASYFPTYGDPRYSGDSDDEMAPSGTGYRSEIFLLEITYQTTKLKVTRTTQHPFRRRGQGQRPFFRCHLTCKMENIQ